LAFIRPENVMQKDSSRETCPITEAS
jgi:hypothetical protein